MRADEINNLNKSNSTQIDTNKVDLNNLMQRVRDEEKKNKRSNVAISAAVVSAVAVFGIILTL
tara:strand:+ start:296 stop:484 length:189 start_codon:yes stop_codon:yes gene_type:complete